MLTISELISERLRIRDIKLSDLVEYHRLVSDDNIYPYIIDDGPLTLSQSYEKLKIMNVSKNPKYLAIALKETNEFIGFIGLFNLESENPAISYAIHPKFQRHGYCFEALQYLIEKIGTEYSSLVARTHPENIASQKLLIKLSFNFIGIVKWGNEDRYEYALSLISNDN